MKVMFVVPPLTGHTNPTVAVGAELVARGHQVAWCGDPAHLAAHVPPDSTILAAAPSGLPEDLAAAIAERGSGLRGAAALKFLWEDFLEPLARWTLPGVAAAADRFDPEVMVVDQQAVAGAVVARQQGRVWATSATTSADLGDAFAGLPKLREWVDDRLVALQVTAGVPAAEATPESLRFSPYLVLAFTTAALMGEVPELGVPLGLVGPAFVGRLASEPFDWGWLDGRPLVLVSLGTVNAAAGERFFGAAAEALAERAVQGVIVADPHMVGPVADNVLVRARIPQVDLLSRASLVVSHGGHNTVCETLAHRVPLVVAPIRDDQPIVADQVVRAGAGVRLKFARTNAAGLGAAIDEVLAQPSYAAAAGRIADSFTAAGGAVAAADLLEGLL